MTNFERVIKAVDGNDKIVKSTLEAECNVAESVGLHTVGIFWVSCFGTLEHRVAYFEEYAEATECSNRFGRECLSANGDEVKFSVYINGKLYLSNNIYEAVLGVR